MNLVETYKINPHFNRGAWVEGKTLKIYVDPDPEDPRTAFDNLGTMICFHRRYNLGDKHNLQADDFSEWDEIEEYLERERNAVIILPLYLYDHSGLAMSTSGVSCPWDSGQVGFIYVSKQTIEKEYGQDTRENRDIARKVMISEVEEYSDYLSGSVYGYTVFADGEDEETESCWGFYGYDGLKYIREETGFDGVTRV